VENILKIILANFFCLSAKIAPHFTAKIAWSFFCKPRVRKQPLNKLETSLLQQSKQYSVDCKGYKISVYEWSNNSSAEQKTVLLTHGWGGHALNFSYLINKLLAEKFKVIAFDSPAHGNSSGKQTNLLYNTYALLGVSEYIGNVDALIGHSFGSMAIAYALDLCKQTTQLSKVKKIVLIASPNKLADIFAAFALAMKLPNSVLTIFHQKLEAMAQRTIHTMSTVEFLQNYRGETLVVHDYNDRIVPFAEAESVAQDTSSSLFSTSGYGHVRILAAADVIDKIIHFLKSK
jgi:pimeloyl-ACP methyl ester carboxylesterase